LDRFKLVEFVSEEPYLRARIELNPETVEEGLEIDALARNARDQFQQITQMIPSFPEELVNSITSLENPLQTAYTIANFQRIELKDAQGILEIDSVTEKLRKLIGLLVRGRVLISEDQNEAAGNREGTRIYSGAVEATKLGDQQEVESRKIETPDAAGRQTAQNRLARGASSSEGIPPWSRPRRTTPTSCAGGPERHFEDVRGRILDFRPKSCSGSQDEARSRPRTDLARRVIWLSAARRGRTSPGVDRGPGQSFSLVACGEAEIAGTAGRTRAAGLAVLRRIDTTRLLDRGTS
jgi:hypothetical protein